MIKDYDFIRYDKEFMMHLSERHFPNSPLPGSIFTGQKFKNPRAVIDGAYLLISDDYNGKRLEKVLTFDYVIGLDSIIPISDIPGFVKIEKVKRRGFEVNVVHNVRKIRTRQMVVIAGPLKRESIIHTFLSIYPGRFAPELSDKTFWQNHAFIE